MKKELTPFEVAKVLVKDWRAMSCLLKLTGNTVEASTPLERRNIQLFTWNDKEGKTAFWHSSAHYLAQELFGTLSQAKLTIGPLLKMVFITM